VQQERRKNARARAPQAGRVTITLADGPGNGRRIVGAAADHGDDGLGVTIPVPLEVGSDVHVEGSLDLNPGTQPINGSAQVRWCTVIGTGFRVGLQWNTSSGSPPAAESIDAADYYELLQLSPNADTDTVNRVFRLLAARYHPDNTETGNDEMFRRIAEAHRVLNDPERRAGYDATYRINRHLRWKIFDSAAVTCGKEAEKRKRSAILAAAYAKRLQQPDQPGVALRELEDLLDCPREHLEFAIWYLKENGLINRADNGRVQITVRGVDFAEELPGVVPADANHLLNAAGA